MKLGSLFDGSGGFPLAGVMNGITPVWASEIEPYPMRVTAARFPQMKQLGDVTKINGAEIEKVDIITFGSPCQDLSVAGKQKGIHDGERSNLFFEAVRIIKEMRDSDRAAGRADEHIRPRFAVWENVPGAFSSNKGRDFQAVLQALCEVADADASVPFPEKGKWSKAGCIVGDGYSIAWRVYDAQYWGVPQRRKRIYLIADFASERAGEILFESEGVCGNPAQSEEAWEGTAADAEGSAGGSSLFEPRSLMEENWSKQNIKNALRAEASKSSHVVVGSFMGGQGAKAGSVAYDEDVSPTLRATPSGSNQTPDIVYCLQGNGIDRADTAGCNGSGWRTGEAYTLNTIDRPAVVYDAHGNGEGGVSPTLTGDHENRVTDYTAVAIYPKTTGALCANSHPGSYTGQDAFNDMLPVVPGKPPRRYIVRRLTPLECCRLQGFPDNWEDGVQGSDSARYKMWGNGIALPCAVDVLRRIAKEMHNETTD